MSDHEHDNPEAEDFDEELDERGDASIADDDGDGQSPGAIADVDEDDRLGRMMAVNFLEYASYVIRDRAIPDVADGLKPVQRRILHSLHSMDDGRFHKVANVIGHTMQYHPHGDASIGSALVVLANKEYFIDRQGNFGNIYTGDEASAARYIECRLTPLAREVLFNRETTEFVDSYDGRNQEPVTLPAKVPVLLMLGADGIAVGMTTRVLPHNFRELLEAQIAVLQGQPFRLYPDFVTGGIMDASEYEDGAGRIKLRARIEEVNEKTLVIREIPATTTTESLTASIEDAVKKGRIKLASINDYTAEQVEIELKLPRGIYAREVIPQLYAYTSCEVSITSNIVVISENMPVEFTVTEVVRRSTDQLVDLLRRELEIKYGKLEDRFHGLTLAQLFIEHRIYKRIEEKETYEEVLAEVHAGLAPFREQLRRDITDEDIEKLLQLQIRRISRFDINRNREELERIVEDMRETRHHLDHLIDYAIHYVEDLIERFAGAHPRRTEVMKLEQVDVKEVALQNIKVGHDRVNQFVGTEVRNSNRNDSPLACTEYDRLLLLKNDGVLRVINIPDKLYVGPLKLCDKHDRDQTFSMLYRHKKSNTYYAKRFKVDRFITDREYNSLPDGCIIVGLYTNQGVELRLDLKPAARRQVDHVEVVFDDIPLRALTARGLKVTSYPVASVVVTKRGTAEVPVAAVPEASPEAVENDETTALPFAEDEPVVPETGKETAPEPEVAEPQPEPEVAAVPEPVPAEEPAPRQRRGKAKSEPEPIAEPVSSEEPPPAEEPAKPEPRKRQAKSKSEPDPEPVSPEEPAPAEESAPPSPRQRKGKAKSEPKPEPVSPAESAPVEEPVPSPRQRKGRAASAPTAAGTESESSAGPQDLAAEWEQRSGRARLHTPAPPAEESAAPEPPPAEETEAASEDQRPESPASPPQPSSSPKPRRRIDEDTPFFLE